MAILISNGKSQELVKISDHFYIKDVFDSNGLATLSGGVEKFEKGFLLKNWIYPCDDIMYMLKGSLKIESDGKTYVVHEGDFMHATKGTKATLNTNEESEAIFVTNPTLRELGAFDDI